MPNVPVLDKVLRAGEGRRLKRLRDAADYIGQLAPDFRDVDLTAKTAELRQRVANGEALEDVLFEAFANVNEAFRRSMAIELFPVQRMGGIVLHEGDIAEMK